MRDLKQTMFLGALLLLTACMAHRPIAPEPAPDGSLGEHRIRAVLHDGSRVLIGEARIAGDTLSGRRLWDLIPVAVPMSEVQRLEVPRVSLLRTAALAVGAGLTWWLGAMWIDSQVVY